MKKLFTVLALIAGLASAAGAVLGMVRGARAARAVDPLIPFYFGHRLLHAKFLYKRFHALHHRNVEVGPWSGLAMHPVEHIIYFSTVVVQ
jgi:sterol desaturase/sphingolipid hydroxylase (fatty acid hydroxylase superfamily)